MITINATGDTTLHTAGKYCSEDILVKVPAGGSGGGASVETCTVAISNDSYALWEIYYSHVVNGEVQTVASVLGDGKYVLENIVKNSYIAIRVGSYDVNPNSVTYTGGVSLVYYYTTNLAAYAGEGAGAIKVADDGTITT